MSRLLPAVLLFLGVASLAPSCEDYRDVVRYEDGEVVLGLPGQGAPPELVGISAVCEGLFDVLVDAQVDDRDGLGDVSRVNVALFGPDDIQIESIRLERMGPTSDQYQGEFDLMGTGIDCDTPLEVRFRARDANGNVDEEFLVVATRF